MKITLITTLWTGSIPIFFNGISTPSGMPAFTKLLKKICTSNTDKVSIILICNEDYYHKELQKAEWLKETDVYKILWNSSGVINNIKSSKRLFSKTNSISLTFKPDLIYIHGPLGLPAYLSAVYHKIPVGQRIYGTFFHDRILKDGLIKTLIRSPFESAAFIFKKKFLIVTDDGTKGDEVVNIICKNKPPYDFYFLQNGVDVISKNKFNLKQNNKFIFYPARITKWKRQDLAIDLLSQIKDINIKLLFAGQIADNEYYHSLLESIKTLGLEDRVVFLGEISHIKTQQLMESALAVAAFYDVSCKGNVSLEAIASECILISFKNRGLDSIVVDGESAILGDSITECATKINKLLQDELAFNKLKKHLSSSIIKSWDERLEQEYNILRIHAEAAKGRIYD